MEVPWAKESLRTSLHLAVVTWTFSGIAMEAIQSPCVLYLFSKCVACSRETLDTRVMG